MFRRYLPGGAKFAQNWPFLALFLTESLWSLNFWCTSALKPYLLRKSIAFRGILTEDSAQKLSPWRN
jgi:hypothetical protein